MHSLCLNAFITLLKVGLCFVFAAFFPILVPGHLREGFMSVRMPKLSEAERMSVIAEAANVNASVLTGAFCADNFLLCERDGVPVAGLCTFTDRGSPHTWEILSRRMHDVLEKRFGIEAKNVSEEAVNAINSGWFMLKDPEEDRFHIELIYVVPQARGSGALSLLLEEAHTLAKKGLYTTR